jgi:hypothetical protein
MSGTGRRRADEGRARAIDARIEDAPALADHTPGEGGLAGGGGAEPLAVPGKIARCSGIQRRPQVRHPARRRIRIRSGRREILTHPHIGPHQRRERTKSGCPPPNSAVGRPSARRNVIRFCASDFANDFCPAIIDWRHMDDALHYFRRGLGYARSSSAARPRRWPQSRSARRSTALISHTAARVRHHTSEFGVRSRADVIDARQRARHIHC